MRRVISVIVLVGGLVAITGTGCGSDEAVAGPQEYGGTAGSIAHDAGGSGGVDGGGAGGSSTGGGSDAGGWPTGGAGGTAGASGAAGTQAGGSGGAATGGAAGTATGGAAGSGTGGATCEGQGGSGGPCAFPQGVPDPDFFCSASAYQDTDPAVDAAVNAVMVTLSGCNPSSDCIITGFPGTTVNEICQSWFAAVAQALRDQGYCAGQHIEGHTDEIAVSDKGCTGKWYGYHICNYGGGKVVWNPGARRGWWMIEPSYCPP